jgi:hypothetical protein
VPIILRTAMALKYMTSKVLTFPVFHGFIILLLFNAHTDLVQSIIFTIAKVNIPSTYIEISLKISAAIFIVLSIYFIGS